MELINENEQRVTKQVNLTQQEEKSGWVLYKGLKYKPCDGGYELRAPSLGEEGSDYSRSVSTLECYEIPRELNGKPVISLGECAFEESSTLSLKRVIIPDTVVDMSGYRVLEGIAFMLSKVEFIIDPKNPKFKMVGNDLCSKDGKTFFAHIWDEEYEEGKEKYYQIPDGITAIDGYCGAFTGVVIPLSMRYMSYFYEGCCIMPNIYYRGTKKDWKQVQLHKVFKDDIKRKKVSVYFYSEKPHRKMWHFADDGVTPVLWHK